MMFSRKPKPPEYVVDTSGQLTNSPSDAYPRRQVEQVAKAVIEQHAHCRRRYHPDAARIITDTAERDNVRNRNALINHIEYWLKKLVKPTWDGSIA